MRSATFALAFTASLFLAGTAAAQGNGKGKRVTSVPPGHQPPAGMCRVWYDDTPPGRQPRATDCATAYRVARASGGRVLVGDRRDSRYDDRRDSRYDDRRDDRRRDDDRRVNACVDRDRDGWCDGGRTRVNEGRTRVGGYYGAGYNAVLPGMLYVAALRRGERGADYARWLGNTRAVATYTDRNRDGMADQLVWRDSRGQVLQVWEDRNFDGRADEVRMYENGRQVQSYR